MEAINPNLDFVGDLFWGVFKPQWIRLVLTLDIFMPLAESLSSAEQVAQACHCDSFSIKTLLAYFYTARILEKNDNLYSLTPTAETFLARGRPAYAGDMILDYTSPAMFESILNSIRTGEPQSLGNLTTSGCFLAFSAGGLVRKSIFDHL